MARRSSVWWAFVSPAAARPGAAQTEPPHPIMPVPGNAGAAELLGSDVHRSAVPRVRAYAGAAWATTASCPPSCPATRAGRGARPRRTSSPACRGTVFPNPTYPILSEAVPVLSGRTVMSRTTSPPAATASRWPRQIDLEAQQGPPDMLALAAAYVRSGADPVTRDDRFARRIAIALDAWANYVPDYFMSGKNSPHVHQRRRLHDADQRHPALLPTTTASLTSGRTTRSWPSTPSTTARP